MTKQEAQKLGHGLYMFQWKDASFSLVAVGSLHDGTRWFAPINWTSKTTEGIASTNWSLVASVSLMVGSADLQDVAARFAGKLPS